MCIVVMARQRRMAAIFPSGRVCNSKGFTLVELLIVLLIVGLLAGLVGPSLYKKVNPAKRTAAKAQINNFVTALDMFFAEIGSYPTQRQGLRVLFYAPEGMGKWNGPYVKKEIPLDPWGNAYSYLTPGRHGPYEIISYGADGKVGGEGENRDITNWETQ